MQWGWQQHSCFFDWLLSIKAVSGYGKEGNHESLYKLMKWKQSEVPGSCKTKILIDLRDAISRQLWIERLSHLQRKRGGLILLLFQQQFADWRERAYHFLFCRHIRFLFSPSRSQFSGCEWLCSTHTCTILWMVVFISRCNTYLEAHVILSIQQCVLQWFNICAWIPVHASLSSESQRGSWSLNAMCGEVYQGSALSWIHLVSCLLLAIY